MSPHRVLCLTNYVFRTISESVGWWGFKKSFDSLQIISNAIFLLFLAGSPSFGLYKFDHHGRVGPKPEQYNQYRPGYF